MDRLQRLIDQVRKDHGIPPPVAISLIRQASPVRVITREKPRMHVQANFIAADQIAVTAWNMNFLAALGTRPEIG